MNRQARKAAAREAVRQAGNVPKKITLIMLLCGAASVAVRLLLDRIGDAAADGYISQSIAGVGQSLVLQYGLSLLLSAVLMLLKAGYVSMAQDLCRGEEVSLWNLLSGFFAAGRVVLWDVLQSLVVVAWVYAAVLTVSFGLALVVTELTTPVVIALYVYAALAMLLVSYRYRGALYLLMDDESLSPWRAIRMAAAMNKGHRWELFKLDLSFVPLVLLCVLTCGILGIWKFPCIAATYAQVYADFYADYQRRRGQAEQIQQRFQERNSEGRDV